MASDSPKKPAKKKRTGSAKHAAGATRSAQAKRAGDEKPTRYRPKNGPGKRRDRKKSSGTAEKNTRELIAGVVAVAMGAPLVFLFASAVLDANSRESSDPVIAMIGSEAFEQLTDGETTPLHYLGNNRRAPDFTLTDQNGRPWRLEDHRGKVVIMNFWSITCPPCIREMPSVVELSRLVKDRDDVEVVSISTDSGWSEVGQIFPRRMHLKVLFDPDRSVTNGKFGSRVFPETWFIDPDGIVRLRVDGPREWDSALVLQLIDKFSS